MSSAKSVMPAADEGLHRRPERAEAPVNVDTGEDEARPVSNSEVLLFVVALWARRPVLLATVVLLLLLAIAFDLALPWTAAHLLDVVAESPRNADRAWMAWALFVGAFLAFSLLRNVAFRAWNPLAAANMKEVTDEAVRRVQSFSTEWYAGQHAGATVRKLSRAMWGYDMVSDAVVVWLGPALLVLLGLSIGMMFRWPLVGGFTLLAIAVFIAVNILLTNGYVRPSNQCSVKLDGGISATIADAITANPSVKAFAAEKREDERVATITEDWRRATLLTWTRFVNVSLLQNLMLVGLQAGLSGMLVALWVKGAASPGDVGFAVTSFMLISGYLRNISENIRMMQKGLDDVADVVAFSRMQPQIVDQESARDLMLTEGEVVFRDVCFRYGGNGRRVYNGLSLTISAGENVALVGATGSGKSTLVKLLQRLHDVDAGQILIDGQDIALLSQASLRRTIAVVPQDLTLFHRTISENIGYGRPEADADAIERVARMAHAHDFITALPHGYHTLVGERGARLSGGERQRIAIARAMLVDAPILVLDEATSALDTETEQHVQTAVHALLQGRTSIVIAHRLSTIERADRILLFDDGRVAESGSHSELMAQGGRYARLHSLRATANVR